MSQHQKRTHPEDLSDDELLERIASKDSETYDLPDIAERALEADQEDESS